MIFGALRCNNVPENPGNIYKFKFLDQLDQNS